MKEITINSRKHGIVKTMVDDADFEWLNQWKWSVKYQAHNDSFYVLRTDVSNGRKKTLIMARLIMGVSDRLLNVDHFDHNTLNNTSLNLRISTIQQNGCNRRKLKATYSKYKGVCKHITKSNGREYVYFRARITINGKLKSLGLFKNEELAAHGYNEAAIKYHGEFAHLNKFN